MNIGIKSDDVKTQAQQITGQAMQEYTELRSFLDTIVCRSCGREREQKRT